MMTYYRCEETYYDQVNDSIQQVEEEEGLVETTIGRSIPVSVSYRIGSKTIRYNTDICGR
eukprot:scaffold630_cov188-Ochromonas_danica.AAC.5